MKIFCKDDYRRLIKKIVKEGVEVNKTYEFVGETISLIKTTETLLETFDISPLFEKEFIEAISKFIKKSIGPYDTEKYFFLIPELKSKIKTLEDDCVETRRCVLRFPEGHCFESIQFMIRENTVNIVCYMRSCNAIKNLPHDIWICSKMADIFKAIVKKLLGIELYEYNKITMMFGSLHVFKEEYTDVL